MNRIDLDLSLFGTTKLGSLIAALSSCRPEDIIVFDFCGIIPTEVSSYRGWYEHLAIRWKNDNYRPKVGDIATCLSEALHQTFQGYKGGEYSMDRDTPVWVDGWGECTSTAIIAVERRQGEVTLVTQRVDI